MKSLGIIVLICLVFGSAGVIFLASWQIPAPTKIVTKMIPNEQFTS